MLLVCALVVALDAATKALAVDLLAGRGDVSVLGGAFHLDLYLNRAGPHDILQGHSALVSLLAIAAVAAIGWAASRVRTRPMAVAAGLMLGGGVGNLLDRLLGSPGPLHGAVIDWLRPPFASGSMNLADLSIAAATLIVASQALRAGGKAPTSIAGSEPSAARSGAQPE